MRETPDRAERAKKYSEMSRAVTIIVVSTENRETEKADRAESCLLNRLWNFDFEWDFESDFN